MTQHAKGILKIIAVFVLGAGLAYLLGEMISKDDLDAIKHQISLGPLIILVVIINIVSGLTMFALYLVYQWIRRDFSDHD
jgi:hypothetical protein